MNLWRIRTSWTTASAGAAALILLAAAPDTAAAQQVIGDVAGGYSLLRMEGVTLPAGWWVSASGQVRPTVAVIGEVTRSSKDEELFGIRADVNVLMASGGVRAMAPRGVARPFADIMVGIGRVTGSVSGLPPGFDEASIEGGVTAFAVQPGAGVDLEITPHLAVRARIETTMLRAEGNWGFGPRFTIGAAYRWTR